MPRNAPRFGDFVALAADQIDDEGRQWIEVMPIADKARNGPWYFTITAADLETYAESIRANAGKTPIDYDHEGAKGSTRAAGWFTGDAEVRTTDGEPRLWAQVEWTPKAQQEIRDGEFRFLSPEFDFEEKEPKSGLLTKAKEIVAATLTNRPFFSELAPVTAAVVWEAGEGLQDLLARVFDSLNPGGYDHAAFWVMDVMQSQALVGEYDGSRTWVVPFSVTDSGEIDIGSRDDWVPAEQEWVEAVQTALQTNRAMRPFTDEPLTKPDDEGKDDDMPTDYLKALGLDETSDDAKKVAAALNQKDEQILAMQAEITELKADGEKTIKLTDRIAELEQRDRKRDVEVLLAKGIDSGRILPAEKDTLSELFAENVSGLKTLLASRPAGFYAGYGRKEKGSGGGATTFDDPDTAAVAREFGATGDDPIDEESAQLHLRAMAILKESGKDRDYDASDYRAALDEAALKVGAF